MNTLSEAHTKVHGKETLPLIDSFKNVNSDHMDNKVFRESSSVPCVVRFTENSSHGAALEARDCPSNESGNEQVEQFEFGVYVSFNILPNGKRGLKRVRFSRNQFSEKEAEKWWDENRCRIFRKYTTQCTDASSTKKWLQAGAFKPL